jgi:uncharacterized protein (TIGR03083 family)
LCNVCRTAEGSAGSTRMKDHDFVTAVVREGGALATAAEIGVSRPVAAYPGWTVADLVAHTGSVHRWVVRVIASTGDVPPERVAHGDRDPRRLIDWYRAGLVELTAALRGAEADRNVWTMAAEQSVAFWRRRMAHETVIHRWDVQHAIGRLSTIDPWIAVTGIPETLEIHLQRPLAGTPLGGTGERIALRCTDIEGRWTVTIGRDRIDIQSGSMDPAVTLAGPASDLWLNIAGRPGPEVERVGDLRAERALRRALRLVAPPSY